MDALQLLHVKVYAISPSKNSLVSKVSIKSKNFALKTVANTKVKSPVTCRARSYHCVMQLLLSCRCISVPSMIVVAAIICEIQT